MMAISDETKKIISDGIWASDPDERVLPSRVGVDRERGWTASYEQHITGRLPERKVWNQRFHEIDSALTDILTYGIPLWDAEVDYVPTEDAHCFVTSAAGKLWYTSTSTGPSYRNVTDPDGPLQSIWREY